MRTAVLCIYIYITIYIYSLKWKHHTRHSKEYKKNRVHED